MTTLSTTHELPMRPQGRHWLHRLVSVIYERCPECCRTRRWQALAYHDYCTGMFVMVIWPLNYAVMLMHWFGYQWDKYRHKPSWIDAMVKDAVRQSEESDARRYIRRALNHANKESSEPGADKKD